MTELDAPIVRAQWLSREGTFEVAIDIQQVTSSARTADVLCDHPGVTIVRRPNVEDLFPLGETYLLRVEPTGGDETRYHLEIDLTDYGTGEYTVSADAYFSPDFDGDARILHSRWFSHDGSAIRAIQDDSSLHSGWRELTEAITISEKPSYMRWFVAFPVQSTRGNVWIKNLQVTAPNGDKLINDGTFPYGRNMRQYIPNRSSERSFSIVPCTNVASPPDCNLEENQFRLVYDGRSLARPTPNTQGHFGMTMHELSDALSENKLKQSNVFVIKIGKMRQADAIKIQLLNDGVVQNKAIYLDLGFHPPPPLALDGKEDAAAHLARRVENAFPGENTRWTDTAQTDYNNYNMRNYEYAWTDARLTWQQHNSRAQLWQGDLLSLTSAEELRTWRLRRRGQIVRKLLDRRRN